MRWFQVWLFWSGTSVGRRGRDTRFVRVTSDGGCSLGASLDAAKEECGGLSAEISHHCFEAKE